MKNNIYSRFFFHIYYLIYIINGRSDRIRSVISTSLLLSLLLTLDITFFIRVLVVNFNNIYLFLAIFIIILFLNCFFFLRNKNYLNLEKRYNIDRKINKVLSYYLLIGLASIAFLLSILDLKLRS